VCETGGGRRAWLRGLVNVSKEHVLRCAAYNLGLLLRKIWGYCKPRNAQAGTPAEILGSLVVLWLSWLALTPVGADGTTEIKILMSALLLAAVFVAGRFLHQLITQNRHSLTGC
jgi:hypothetical protein